MKSSDLMRAPGRPKAIDGEGSTLAIYVPETLHDRIVKAAGSQSVSAMMRPILERAFPTDK